MYLTRHEAKDGPRWALNGRFLPSAFSLDLLLQLPRAGFPGLLSSLAPGEPANDPLLAPCEPLHEVWACGVTYLRSREAREAESAAKDVYSKVYEAERPEVFWKAIGWRVAGHDAPIRVRADSAWSVPEPELALVINSRLEIVGYSICNDVSSRDIEGENPLYLPQAKVYDGSCALGPGIILADADDLRDLPVALVVTRVGKPVFQGETRTSQMVRPLEELVAYLGKELILPHGTFLATGTGIVPPEDFSMAPGDTVRITIGDLTLSNPVAPPR